MAMHKTPSSELAFAEEQATLNLTAADHYELAQIFLQYNRLDKALLQFNKALAQAEDTEDVIEVMRASSGLAFIHHQQGNFGLAARLHQQVIKICPPDEIFFHLENLDGAGLNLYREDNLEAAEQAYRALISSSIASQADLQYAFQITGYLGLSGLRFRQDQCGKAVENATRALELAKERKVDSLLAAAALTSANAHLRQNDMKAVKLYQEALQIAEKLEDVRHQCRALCGAGLCYYACGDLQGAVKLFQTALHRDKMVQQSSSCHPVPSPDQLVDEQLLLLLHRILSPLGAPESKADVIISTMFMGLTAVLMNLGLVAAAATLPAGLLSAVTRSLVTGSNAKTGNPVCARYYPFLQHYCVHILQQFVRQRPLRPLLVSESVADALIMCMAYPVDQNSAPGLQPYASAVRTLKAIVGCAIPDVSRAQICDLFLRSPHLTLLLDVLPQRTANFHVSRLHQALEVMTALHIFVQWFADVQPSASPGRCPVSPGRPAASVDVTPIVTAVCKVIRSMMDREVFLEVDLQMLDSCLRLLLKICKRLPPFKRLILRRLEPRHLERLSTRDLPPSSPVAPLAAELCKLIKEYAEWRTSSRSDETASVDENTVHDLTPTDVSSQSSHSCVLSPRRAVGLTTPTRLSAPFDDVDTEDMTMMESWLDDEPDYE